MAVKEVVVRTRPNTSVPFCRAKDVGLPDDHGALELASGEVISFDVTFSEDGLTRTTTTIFKDEETRTSYTCVSYLPFFILNRYIGVIHYIL